MAGAMHWIDELGVAWRREYKGVDTAPLPPLVRLARLALLIEQLQSEVLAPFDLSAGDYGVLAMLRRAGAPYALTPSQLYGRLQRSSGGMTKILKRLEDGGFVRRAPDPADGRGSLVSLTRAGLELQDRVFHAFLSASQDLLAPLSAAKLRESDRALRALLDCFEDYLSA
ncbi:MAG: MarR family winged helix-turn-helix transcriptional regulator [Myxococcota bacterium]